MVVCSENAFGFDIASKTMPQRIATTAATICPASLTHALRLTISSIAPMTTIISAPSRMPSTGVDTSTNMSSDSTKPMKMASPPMRGIGWSCTRRSSFGISIAPTFSAKRLTGGVIMNDTAAANAIASSSLSHSDISEIIAFLS